MIVRRAVDAPTEIQYTLSNAPADTPTPPTGVYARAVLWDGASLAEPQTGRGAGALPSAPLAELALSPGVDDDGDAVYTGEERRLHHQFQLLLSGTDIRALLNHFLPRRDTTLEEVLRQMEVRHRKRQVVIDSTCHRQQLRE